jgi:hypothetical protein
MRLPALHLWAGLPMRQDRKSLRMWTQLPMRRLRLHEREGPGLMRQDPGFRHPEPGSPPSETTLGRDLRNLGGWRLQGLDSEEGEKMRFVIAALAQTGAAPSAPPSGRPADPGAGGWPVTLGVAPVASPAWQGSRDMTFALSGHPDQLPGRDLRLDP